MQLTLSIQKQHGVSYFQIYSLLTHVKSSIITRIVLHLSTFLFDKSNSCFSCAIMQNDEFNLWIKVKIF